ncbi:MAG: MFS transporter [Chloroflexi bacterium]|nr:MFS transporter [Chloroflexota bacterium]
MNTSEATEARARRWRWESLTGGGVLFQDDDFRRLWLGRLLANTALNAVLYTLLVLAVGEGNGASLKSALFITAYLLPTATLGTFSGVVVDRLPKNFVMAAVNITRAVLMVMLLLAGDNLLTVYLVALLIAVTSQLSGPAEAAALPHVVRPDQLTRAISTNNFGGLVSQVVGFAVLPPLFLNTIGHRPLFFVAAGLFAGAAAVFYGIGGLGSRRINIARSKDAVRDVRSQFAEAWETLARDTVAYMSVIIVVLASTASLVGVTVMPLFMHEVLDIEVRNAIFVFLPAAAGIIAGLRLVHLLERRVARGWLVGAGFGLLAASFVCLGLTVPFANALEEINPFGVFDPGPFGETSARIVVTIVFSTVAAFAYSVLGVSTRSLVNERIPVQMQGRVFAAQVVLTNLASIPPILLAGALADVAGVQPVMILTVALLVVAAAWAFARAIFRPEVTRHVEAG